MKKHVSTLGIGALSLLIIVSTATSAQANPSPSPTPPTEEQAFETDAIALQAAGYNMTPEDVRRSNEFNKLAAEMYLDFPDDYSTAVFNDDEDSGPQIFFSGEIPSAAQEKIDHSSIKLAVVSNSGISENRRSEIDALLAESVLGAQESTDCTEGALITVSPEDGSAEIRTPCAALPEAMKAQWSSQRIAIPEVNFEIDPSAVAEPEVMSGGTMLTGSKNCTAGFTVRNARTGQKGITTAGHCVDNLKYEGTTQLTLAGHGGPLNMDFQWHTANRTVWSYFAAMKVNGVQQNRLQTGSALPTHASSICKYGQVTGYGCDLVRSGPHTFVHEGKTYTHVWTSNNYISAGGDSGGPWFSGNTAYGLHWGRLPWAFEDRSAFTAFIRIEQQTDLRLLTGCTSPC